MYTHGNGNSESTGSYTLTTVRSTPLKQEVKAKASASDWDTQGTVCKAPPWLVKQFSCFKLDGCSSRDLDSVTIELPEGAKTVAGRVYRAHYLLTDEKRNPVAYAVWKNYVDALQAIGARLVSDPRRNYTAALTRSTPQGELWYVYQHRSTRFQ